MQYYFNGCFHGEYGHMITPTGKNPSGHHATEKITKTWTKSQLDKTPHSIYVSHENCWGQSGFVTPFARIYTRK